MQLPEHRVYGTTSTTTLLQRKSQEGQRPMDALDACAPALSKAEPALKPQRSIHSHMPLTPLESQRSIHSHVPFPALQSERSIHSHRLSIVQEAAAKAARDVPQVATAADSPVEATPPKPSEPYSTKASAGSTEPGSVASPVVPPESPRNGERSVTEVEHFGALGAEDVRHLGGDAPLLPRNAFLQYTAGVKAMHEGGAGGACKAPASGGRACGKGIRRTHAIHQPKGQQH